MSTSMSDLQTSARITNAVGYKEKVERTSVDQSQDISALEKLNKGLKLKLKRVEDDNKSVKVELVDSRAKLEEQQRLMLGLKEENAVLVERLFEAMSCIQDCEARVLAEDAVKAELVATKVDNAALRSEIAKIRSEHAALLENREAKEETGQTATDILQQQIKQLQVTSTAASRKIEKLERSYRRKCERNDELKEEKDTLMNEKEELQEEVDDLHEIVRLNDRKIKKLERSLSGKGKDVRFDNSSDDDHSDMGSSDLKLGEDKLSEPDVQKREAVEVQGGIEKTGDPALMPVEVGEQVLPADDDEDEEIDPREQMSLADLKHKLLAEKALLVAKQIERDPATVLKRTATSNHGQQLQVPSAVRRSFRSTHVIDDSDEDYSGGGSDGGGGGDKDDVSAVGDEDVGSVVNESNIGDSSGGEDDDSSSSSGSSSSEEEEEDDESESEAEAEKR